jgi:hypothetical protein
LWLFRKQRANAANPIRLITERLTASSGELKSFCDFSDNVISEHPNVAYEFGSVRLEVGEHRLLCPGPSPSGSATILRDTCLWTESERLPN